MGFLESLSTKIRKAETPYYRALKSLGKALVTFSFPAPRALFPLYRTAYFLRFFLEDSFQWALTTLFRMPLFRSRCQTVGRGLWMERLPRITGHTLISLGNNVRLSGKVTIGSPHLYDKPTLTIGNDVFVGHMTIFDVGQEITVGDGVLIAGGCYISDNDGHPAGAYARARGMPVGPEGVRPVRIGALAWLGRSATILKGVTIGEGAIVGAGSVVTKDVPPFTLVAGNPAKVIKPIPPGEPLPKDIPVPNGSQS